MCHETETGKVCRQSVLESVAIVVEVFFVENDDLYQCHISVTSIN